MAERINMGWLKDKAEQKFAPRTLTTQVQTPEGVPLDKALEKLAQEIPTKLPNPHPLIINGTSYDGSEEVGLDLATTGYHVPVTRYGAKGDGTTDDTVAFQTALGDNRVVFVPGGTYVLSDTLTIGANCCLELSQDTVLKFTQTSGNAIVMQGSATLRGNHAIISVPYAYTGEVICMDTTLDGEAHNSIPPYPKADPMFKRQRFVYDVNIIKPNAAGFNRSTDGKCNGTAIYMSAEGTASIRWMWAITMSGVRIAGGFNYGIRAVNHDKAGDYEDNAWNHDMRIEAVVEGCEVGVSLENCNCAHLQVTVQPTQATDGTKFAKHGVVLNDSKNVDMMGSRVWDWNANNSLWTSGGEYQHLALIGDCRGLILDDFIYWETSADIYDLIYTDTESNFEKMTLLQQPANKWFKSVDNAPYFWNGTANKRIRLKEDKITAEEVEFISPADGYYTYEDNFTNLVTGYTDGAYILANGTTGAASGYVTTDFIPFDGGTNHTYRIGGDGVVWKDSYQYGRIAWYDSNKALKGSPMSWEKVGSNIYYPKWVEDEKAAAAFSTDANVAPPNGAAYFRISAKGSGANLKVTIDEPLDYTAIWHGEPKRLDDSVKVKGENIVGSASDWNAAEGEPGHVLNRTHYEEWAEIMPEQALVWSNELESFVLPEGLSLTVGNRYKVTWNGATYECECFHMVLDDISFNFIGNLAVLGGEDTGEPFMIPEMDGMLSGVDVTGATEVTASLREGVVVKLPLRLVESSNFYLDITKAEDGTYSVEVTPMQLSEVINAGRDIVGRIISYDPLNECYTYTHAQLTRYTVVGFQGMLLVNSVILTGYDAKKYTYVILGVNDTFDDPYSVAVSTGQVT